jgi:hypothetical protein
LGIGQRPTDLALDLYQIKRNIAPFEVSNSENRVYGNTRELFYFF